jgi:hypothetical protein
LVANLDWSGNCQLRVKIASLDDVAELLDRTPIEEKDTDAPLTRLAEEQANVDSA